MGDFIPVILPDEGEAASVWRLEKLKDFEWRAKCLGINDDPAILALISEIKQETSELEGLWEQQQRPDYHRKWWQDGEYDSQKADAANDAALAQFKNGDYGEAFQGFTEAIRLCPTSAVYHSNRSIAALKLDKADIAADDAENALARDPQSLKALLRAGKAYLLFKNPDKAEDHFERAAELDANCSAAQKGLADTAALRKQLLEHEAAQQAVADAGARPELPKTDINVENAAMQLISAEQVLATNSKSESALCSKVEALILCGRFGDALTACEQLRTGVERVYLEAEALWRNGDVKKAWEKLNTCSAAAAVSKCTDLKTFLEQIRGQLEEIEADMEQEMFLNVVEKCTELLSLLEPGACTGLYCLLLRHRANADANRRHWKEARKDLDKALELQSSDAEALKLRADLHKATGNYLDYFLDVQRLKRIMPDLPGLGALLEDAARLCSHYSSCTGGSPDDVASNIVTGPKSAFDVLGLQQHAVHAQVRRAYLKLAAEWHPDKWSTGSESEKQKAEEQFKKVQAAYEMLTGGGISER